jgi:hypothetical protein
MNLQVELLKLWMAYQNSGTPYGNTFIGFMEWLKDKEVG